MAVVWQAMDGRLLKALKFAVKQHGEMLEDGRDPMPFVSHPIEVARILRYLGDVADEDMIVAALLHDTIEQSGTSPSRIKKKFGPNVLALVEELTRKGKSHDPKKSRALRFAALLQEVEQMSPSAKTIKLADRISNLRSASRKGAKRDSYEEESRQLLDRIPRDLNPALWDEAARLCQKPAPG